MATRLMIANRAMRYGGKVLSAGDEFKASRQDARVLEALGRAAGAPGTVPQPTAPEPIEAPAPGWQPPRPPEPVDTLDHDEDEQEGDSMAGQASTRGRALTKAQLAAEYAKATGGKPDGRWNKNRLEQELEAVRGTYRRRDMRAQD